MALRDLSLIKEGVGLVRLIPSVSYLYFIVYNNLTNESL